MAFKLNGKPLAVDVPFTVGNINYPANWLRLTSLDEKKAIGITEVDDDPVYDSRFYNSDGTAKSLDDYASYLRAYDKIFVRDENTKRLLKSNNIGAEKVLDPTLLIDIPKSITRDIYSHQRNIVVYYCVNQNHDFYKSAKEYALSIGAELVSIGYKHPNAKNLIGIGPIEWLEIMNNSRAVFTDMYHGTIFAAKLQKKLSVNVTEYRRNKMTDLINNLSLWNNVWSKGSSALESSTEAADTLSSFSKERILDAIKN